MANVNFTVAKRLLQNTPSSNKEDFGGILLGYHHQDTLHVVGASSCEFLSAESIVEDFQTVASYIPGGVESCGVFFASEQNNAHILEKICQRILPSDLEDVIGTDAIIVCVIPTNGEERNPAVYWFADQQLKPASVEYTDKHPTDELVVLKLNAVLPFTFCYQEDKDELQANVEAEIEDLKSKLLGNSIVLQVENTDVLLHQIDGCLTKSLPTDANLSELLSYMTMDSASSSKRSEKGKQKVVELKMLRQISGDRALEEALNCAPIINHDLEESIDISLNVPLDVVAFVSKDSHIYSIPSLLVDTAVEQLNQVQKCLVEHSEGEEFYMPKAYHFKPEQCNHMITVIYPEGKDETDLEETRRRLHKCFLIKPVRPTFKKVQAHSFSRDREANVYLENPHEGLGPSGVKDGKTYLVDGVYSYHHYMQDRFDDNKWGCAYRSLQTLVSWFRHQGYTDVAIPTHKKVQEILVELGDKEASFVGSRKWIGSTEVSYVLDHLLGVSSKILFVSNGAELGNKGRELAIHFETQGTPIMIGGGVLAHTILGVDFNETTGDLKFLILDPHYTGAEDLKTILDKGWCGWKGVDFWDKNAYYNLCMPQRPLAV